MPRSERKDFKALAPDAYDVVLALGQAAAKAGIDKQLLELIKLRASQINGCAFCVQYHILLGESLGIAADKLNLVVVWREAPLFSAARARGTGVDRSADAADRRRQRRGLCASERGVFREGTGLSHLGDRLDQCLEQVRRRLSLDPAGAAKAAPMRRRHNGFSSRRLPGCRDEEHPPARHAPRRSRRRFRARSRGRVRGSGAHRPRSA